jgi:hypothetical protein
MVDSSTARTPLGAPTTNRKFYCDVDSNLTGTGAATWIGIFGVTEFQDANEPTLQDDSDFESNGFKSQAVTALAASVSLKVKRSTTAADRTKYDPGQEILRKAGNKVGVDNRVHIRYYEMEPNGPRVEAYEMFATVTWSPDGGGMDALSTVSVTLTGQGERKAITHPAAA